MPATWTWRPHHRPRSARSWSADGAWDPSNPNDYYLVTSASMTKHRWLWKLSFVHAAKPELGGAITKVFEGPADDSPASNRSRRRRIDS